MSLDSKHNTIKTLFLILNIIIGQTILNIITCYQSLHLIVWNQDLICCILPKGKICTANKWLPNIMNIVTVNFIACISIYILALVLVTFYFLLLCKNERVCFRMYYGHKRPERVKLSTLLLLSIFLFLHCFYSYAISVKTVDYFSAGN